MPDVSVRNADHSVEEEGDRILEGWWGDEDEDKPPKKKRVKKTEPPPEEEVSNLDTSEEMSEEDAEALAELLVNPLWMLGLMVTRQTGTEDYTEEEARQLATAGIPVLVKYLPGAGEFGPEATLVLVLIAQIGARAMQPKTTGREVGVIDGQGN